jgi:hypothetical protein
MIKLTDKEREGYDILRKEMPDTLAMELVEYRRERKARITARIARSLLEKYKQFGNIEQAITTQMERNWIGFEIDWLKRPSKFTEQHHPTPRNGANYGNPSNDITPIPKMTEEERARRAEMAERARQAIRGVVA